jgi:hypothetical protein
VIGSSTALFKSQKGLEGYQPSLAHNFLTTFNPNFKTAILFSITELSSNYISRAIG